MLKLLLTQENLNLGRWKNDTDAISVFCQKTRFIYLPDRFGFLNQFSKWDLAEWHTPFPDTSFIGSLHDIILYRAIELYTMAKHDGKDIYILWSGGVDSTAIVVAFLQILDTSTDIIHILHTKSSINEFPEFYGMLAGQKCVKLHPIEFSEIEETITGIEGIGYVVTGFPADQLFGSIINQTLPLSYNDDWRCFIEVDDAVSQFESAFSYYGIPIRTVSQFTWFMNFACKWELVKRMFFAEFGFVSNNILNFFDTNKFQNWSVSNFDYLHTNPQTDNRYYKKELKEFIHKFYPCSTYFRDKGKIGSIAYACRINPINKTHAPRVAYLDSDDVVNVVTYQEWDTSEDYLKGKIALVNRILRKARKPDNHV